MKLLDICALRRKHFIESSLFIYFLCTSLHGLNGVLYKLYGLTFDKSISTCLFLSMRFFDFDSVIACDYKTGERQKLHSLISPPIPLGLRSCGRLFGAHYGESLGRLRRSADKKANLGTKKKSQCCISATASPLDVDMDDGSSVDGGAENMVQAGAGWFDAFYRFSRPHTIIGSVSGFYS